MNAAKDSNTTPLIHIIRHGQSLHNVDRGYPHRDPPLTESGQDATKLIRIPRIPDLIIISPMTRTIQTTMNSFPSLLGTTPFKVPVQIWPDLREAHDAICNKGLSRTEIMAKFPQFNFAECPLKWDHPPHTIEGATVRAEAVRLRSNELSETYRNIAVVTHRGFISFLVQGERFNVCESRTYRFATDEEAQGRRFGVNCDNQRSQDFGPTVLVPYNADEEFINTDVKPTEHFS